MLNLILEAYDVESMIISVPIDRLTLPTMCIFAPVL